MTPDELSKNLDKIKMPQNFLLIKSVKGVFEHQKLVNKIQKEIDKYLEEYWQSKFFGREELEKIIPISDRKKFIKGDWEEQIKYSHHKNGSIFNYGGNMGYKGVHCVIIDYKNNSLIPVSGSYSKTAFNENGTEIHVTFVDGYFFRFNYDEHQYDDIYTYKFSTKTNEYLGVDYERIKYSGRNNAPWNR